MTHGLTNTLNTLEVKYKPLLYSCPNSCLSALKISRRDALEEEAMLGLSLMVPQLSSIELSGCSSMSAPALGILLGDARRLNTVNLSGCQGMGDE